MTPLAIRLAGLAATALLLLAALGASDPDLQSSARIVLVAAVIGLLVFDERLTWNEPVGAVVVVVGIIIAQGLPRLRQGRGGLSPTTAQPPRSAPRPR